MFVSLFVLFYYVSFQIKLQFRAVGVGGGHDYLAGDGADAGWTVEGRVEDDF